MKIKKFNDISQINKCNLPDDEIIIKNFEKAYFLINLDSYKNIMVSISGGSDSDIVLDICYRCDKDNKCRYVWFDTGLEYQATKDHLKFLEDKYSIRIEKEKAIKPIPLSCKEYGQPFLSKFVDECMSQLQKHGFKWENGTYENLVKKYPNCKSALHWWTNTNETTKYGYSYFNINYNKYLKEFILENPPWFKISNKCCDYAKKNVSKQYVKNNNIDMVITGIRKSEGGVRSGKYNTCFIDRWDYVMYMPVFWYKNDTKRKYMEYFDIQNSDCYTKYGFSRTGCACCPYAYFGSLKHELKVTKKYEPNLHKAVCSVFHDSYIYTKKFDKFRMEMKEKEKQNK